MVGWLCEEVIGIANLGQHRGDRWLALLASCMWGAQITYFSLDNVEIAK